jgi:hypothetical protein
MKVYFASESFFLRSSCSPLFFYYSLVWPRKKKLRALRGKKGKNTGENIALAFVVVFILFRGKGKLGSVLGKNVV